MSSNVDLASGWRNKDLGVKIISCKYKNGKKLRLFIYHMIERDDCFVHFGSVLLYL